jgi:UDP-N-acetylglucosamine 1-carboxyvinyltransferase
MRTTSAPGASIDCEARAVAARLRAVREGAGITQAELALRLGTTQSAVARLEAGRQRLNLATIRRVAEALDCDATLVIRERRTA